MKQLLILVLLLSGTVFSDTYILELVESSQTFNDEKKLVGSSEMRTRQVIKITRQKKQDEDRTVLRLEVLDTAFVSKQEGEHLTINSDDFMNAFDNLSQKRSIALDVDEDMLSATINNISIEGKDWEQLLGTEVGRLVLDGKLSVSDVTATAYILWHLPLMSSLPQDILPGDKVTLRFPASRPASPGSLSSEACPQYLICVGKEADNVTLRSCETNGFLFGSTI